MSATKKNAKGSKTAHVLNLLTAPGAAKESAAPAEEEAAVESAAPEAPVSSRPLLPPILEVAQANDDSLAQQIQQALEEELQPDAPAVPASSGLPLEEQPILEEVSPPMPDRPASSGKMSQEEIEKLLSAASAPADEPAPDPEPAPAPLAPSGGKMSQEEIEKLLSAASAPADEPASDPEPAPASPAPSGGKMSQEEIEKLLSAASAPADEPAPDPEPAPASPAPSGGKMSQEEIEKLLSAASAPADEPVPEPEPPAPVSKAPKPTSAAEEDEDISYINIMQTLVEEKAASYMKKFGLCTCKHCEADVKALTLSNLIPKYVVLTKLDRIPMLTVYEGRFNTTIFAQLTRACKTVMDHPHHNREE